MEKTYIPKKQLESRVYFTQAAWDSLYEKIKAIFPHVQLPATLVWESGELHPESFMRYNVQEVQDRQPGRYSVVARYFVDDSLPYYSAESMYLHVSVAEGNAWHAIECTYDIDTAVMRVTHNLSPKEEAHLLAEWENEL